MGPLPPGHTRARLVAAVAVCAALAVVVPVGAMRWTERTRPTSLDHDSVASGATTPGRPPSCAGRSAKAPRELRGMWLTTVYNIDWPSRPGLDAETVKAEYRGWLDLAQRLNHNAIFVHIRPSGDALWPSPFAPWSNWLTGRLDGRSPGWDPLDFIIAEAHARNLEFHAWFNPYRGTQPAPKGGAGKDLNRLAPNHPLRQHPEWAVVYPAGTSASRLYFNPGIPEARRFVEDSMLDAITRYDIDGVHFDDFFYPYPEAAQDFNDAATFTKYGGGFASKGDWRRDNVNKLVQEMSQRIKAVKPWVKFGISPFGIWRNSATDPLGSPTRGLQSYDEIYADTRLWVKKQWLDYIVPQLYWHIGFDRADYAKLLPWWSKQVAGTRVQLYIGQADYRVGEKGAWRDPGELDRQLTLNRRHAVSGSVHFSAKDVREDRLGAVTRYRSAHYAGPALVPTMEHLPRSTPAAPILTAARRVASGAVTLAWRAGRGAPATGFAVYRVDETTPVGGATDSNASLVATSRSTGEGEHTWVDRTAASGGSYAYCVTAVDRLWNEGVASAPRRVR
jgi:uncharacterized lipoprotein YddW (UPF0748 family)